MSFLLFLLVTATLFVRPAEIVSVLEGLPIYNVLIVGCLAASLPRVLAQLRPKALKRQPITACVVGLVAAVFLSHASYGNLWNARNNAIEFSKNAAYYLLLVANVNSPKRLRFFLFWLLGCIVVVAGLALLQYHGVINIEALKTLEEESIDKQTGAMIVMPRMRSTGIFKDPNDLSMLLVVGMVLAGYSFFDPRVVFFKPALFGALAMFFYALILTKSRGGLLALLVALGALFQARFGWKKAALLGALALPALVVLAGGRQADISGGVSEGTGQSRIQLWSYGLTMFRWFPLFGVGHDQYREWAGNVAHNSFLHAFSELGVVGGVLLLGAFYYAVRALYRLGQRGRRFADLELARLRPYLLGSLAGYSAAMLTLSRNDVVPTYLALGLPVAYLGQAHVVPPLEGTELSWKLIKEFIKVSVLFLVAVYVFVRLFAQWNG